MTEEKARKIAATAAGIREDQVDVAVKAYREALCDLFNDEPEWYVALFFAGSATCVAEGTEIQMHFHPTAGKTPSQRLYRLCDQYPALSVAREGVKGVSR